MLESKKEALLSELVAQLCAERNFAFPQVQGFDELWQHFRALVNTREPAPISPFWLEKQDELLSGLLAEAVFLVSTTPPSARLILGFVCGRVTLPA